MKLSILMPSVFCFLMGINLEAQVKINPKVGLTFSAISTESTVVETEDKVRLGLSLGVDVRVKKNAFFFQPGIHFTSTSAQLVKLENNTSTTKVEDIVFVSGLKIPLNGGVYLTGKGGVLRLRLDAGLVANVPLKVQKNDIGFTKDTYAPVEIGINGGLGIEVLFLTLDFRIEQGLSKYFKDIDGKTNMFTVAAGFVF